MLPATPPTLQLYAVVPAEEASRLPARRSFSVLTCGPITALFGLPRPRRPCRLRRSGDLSSGRSGHSSSHSGDITVRAALRHSLIVGLALSNCSSVVPFRAGLELASTAELEAFLRLNRRQLADQMERFRGRVEMGLKMSLREPATPVTPARDLASLLPRGLDRVRALAPEPSDRCERLSFSRRGEARGKLFVASYLVSRQAIDEFWLAVDGVRRLAPELPLLGSGPWAAYSFCDVPLGRAAAPLPKTPESEV